MSEVKVSVFKSILISLLVIIIYIFIKLGFEIIHFHFWPFILLTIFHTMFKDKMNLTHQEIALGGAVGITLG